MAILDDINEYKLNQFTNDSYTPDLQDKFDDPDYYAQPKNTKIYLTLNGQEELIGNAVVTNIEETNEKIPVYSYNSSTYQKYLQGKKIVTGVIALRKITLSNFLVMTKEKHLNENKNHEKENLLNDLKELEKINDDKVKNIKNLLEQKINNLDNFYNNQLELYSGKLLSDSLKNNLIDYIEDLNGDAEDDVTSGKIKIVFEGSNGEKNSPIVKIKDVLFLKKQTEVSVERNDIFEVYSFMGNPVKE